MRQGLIKIGATQGLTIPDGDEKPEQVYVWVIADPEVRSIQVIVDGEYKDEELSPRDILIEGWVGYEIPMKMKLTRMQANGLAKLLIDALGVDAPGRQEVPASLS